MGSRHMDAARPRFFGRSLLAGKRLRRRALPCPSSGTRHATFAFASASRAFASRVALEPSFPNGSRDGARWQGPSLKGLLNEVSPKTVARIKDGLTHAVSRRKSHRSRVGVKSPPDHGVAHDHHSLSEKARRWANGGCGPTSTAPLQCDAASRFRTLPRANALVTRQVARVLELALTLSHRFPSRWHHSPAEAPALARVERARSEGRRRLTARAGAAACQMTAMAGACASEGERRKCAPGWTRRSAKEENSRPSAALTPSSPSAHEPFAGAR
jgi:hypothetical protein